MTRRRSRFDPRTPRREIDWAAIAPGVIEELLPEPNRGSTERDQRYRTKGGLSVDPTSGVFYDFEEEKGGGLLDLVMRERELSSRRDAFEWLEQHMHVDREPIFRRSAPSRRSPPRVPLPAPKALDAADPRCALACEIWRLAWQIRRSGREGVVWRYLARRRVWAPPAVAPDLPASMRYLRAISDPPRDKSAKWYGLPPRADGALVFAWCRPGHDSPCAVSLVALDGDGQRITWHDADIKTRLVASRRGALFVARAGEPGTDTVHIVEGELDALAVAIAGADPRHRVVAAGGTSGLLHADALVTEPNVILHCDGDRGGRVAATQVQLRILASGRRARIRWYAPGSDPAAELAETVGERIAIREIDGCEFGSVAEPAAWEDILAPPEEVQ